MVSVDLLDAYFLLEMENEAMEDGDKPSLTKLPDLVLRKVTKELDFQSVKNFRETSSRLLHLTPSPFEQLKAIEIKIDYEEIVVFFRSEETTHKTMRVLQDDKTWEMLLLFDWDFIFRQRKTPLTFFSIEFERYNKHPDVSHLFKIFKQILKNRPPILAEIIYLDVSSEDDLLSILPHVDPRFLKAINLSAGAGDLKKDFTMEKLYGLEQWKKAEELEIWNMPKLKRKVDLKQFSHFSYYSVASSQALKTWGVKRRNNCFKPVKQREDAERKESLREMLRRYPDINQHEDGICIIS